MSNSRRVDKDDGDDKDASKQKRVESFPFEKEALAFPSHLRLHLHPLNLRLPLLTLPYPNSDA